VNTLLSYLFVEAVIIVAFIGWWIGL